MIEVLKQRIASFSSHEEKYAEIREYLQVLILRIIETKGYYKHLAFVGGTSLRILFGINRFSEDLDFSLIEGQGYEFTTLLVAIKSTLVAYGFEVSVSKKESSTVHSSFIKFSHLLFELGLTSQPTQLLSIKLEIDTNPPNGYALMFTPVNKPFLLNIRHFDLPSLFSGKLHAILCRKYTKGRDWYDLVWFIANKVIPNYRLLTKAYFQTESQTVEFDKAVLIEKLVYKLRDINLESLRSDVAPFLRDKTELRFFEKEALLTILNNVQ